MITPRTIKVRTGAMTTGHKTYFISIPWQIAEYVPDGTLFIPEFVDDGILLRVYKEQNANLDPPSWAKGTE